MESLKKLLYVCNYFLVLVNKIDYKYVLLL